MGNIPERQQPKPEGIIKIGQEFQLFAPGHTTSTHKRDYDEFKSNVVLTDKRIPSIPLSILTLWQVRLKTEAITPFDPSQGYLISQADYDSQTRQQKLRMLTGELSTKSRGWFNDKAAWIDSKKYPTSLLIVLDRGNERYNEHFEQLYAKFNNTSSEFKQDVLSLLRKLRVLLNFPNGSSYESIPEIDLRLPHQVIGFSLFYPAEKGPLATGKLPADLISEVETKGMESIEKPGLKLLVPSEINQLSQIRAKFVLAEEKPREANQTPDVPKIHFQI